MNLYIVRDDSTNQMVVFDKHLQFSHAISGTGWGNVWFQYITGTAFSTQEGIRFYCRS